MPNPKNYRKVAANPEAGWHNLRNSKILQQGLGDAILQKREDGWPMTRIAEFFSLDRFTVKLFLENFNALPPDLKKEAREYMRQNNVWDLVQRVQDLFDKIESKLEILDTMGNGTAQLMSYREFIGEQRQVLQLAATILKDAAKLEHQKTIVNIILGEIAQESLECRDRIAARLRSIKDINLLMGGGM